MLLEQLKSYGLVRRDYIRAQCTYGKWKIEHAMLLEQLKSYGLVRRDYTRARCTYGKWKIEHDPNYVDVCISEERLNMLPIL
jgi:hypothetical protein